MTIKQDFLSPTQYVKQCRPLTEVSQIVLHHTCGSTAEGALDWWNKTAERVATHYLIDLDGTITQAFDLSFWAYHLYIPAKDNLLLKNEKTGKNVIPAQFLTKEYDTLMAKKTIGIEIVSYGELKYENGKYLTSWGKEVPQSELEYYPKRFKGCHNYHRYTDAQIAALKSLLQHLNTVMPHIPLAYNPDMWAVNLDAIGGKSGVWTHVSYRNGKSDCHPQPELIAMLQSLTTTEKI